MVSAWTLQSALTDEYKSKARAVADTIAGASVDNLLNRDAASVQAVIDQYAEIQGVAYIFVVDPHGEVLCHTFAPRVPAAVLGLDEDPRKTTERTLRVEGYGECLDVSAPILAGQIGYVHVGMEQSHISAVVGNAMRWQVALMTLVFLAAVAVGVPADDAHLPAAAPADARGREGRGAGRAGPGRGGGRQGVGAGRRPARRGGPAGPRPGPHARGDRRPRAAAQGGGRDPTPQRTLFPLFN